MKKMMSLLMCFYELMDSNISFAQSIKITGSCGMLVNVSKWAEPIVFGQSDSSSNNFLLLVNFDTGVMTGYATNLTFGANSSVQPTYSVGIGSINFTQSADALNGFYQLTPTDLTKMPIFKVLPVNNGNTFLIITGGTDRNGSGATAICQKQ
jgi:hypothetical protein